MYQENHSFDETLGQFCKVHHNRCDGYVGNVRLANGVVAPMTKSKDIVPNVWHDITTQQQAIHRGKMDGWNNVRGCNPPYHPRNCLTYYTPKQIPNLTALAEHYVVSDRTFSMYYSPSWGGHLYAAAATQDHFTGELPYEKPGVPRRPGMGLQLEPGRDLDRPGDRERLRATVVHPGPARHARPRAKYPNRGAFRPTKVKWVPTIFDRLDGKHLSWKLYSSTAVWGICPSFAECLYGPQHSHVVSPGSILADAQNGTLPAYSVLLPEGPGAGTDQHNHNSMRVGDNWIGKALDAIQHGPEWSSTAVFITYDDCGCFYDHVPPGSNADGSKQGIRVPMVIVSPYAKRAGTDHHAAYVRVDPEVHRRDLRPPRAVGERPRRVRLPRILQLQEDTNRSAGGAGRNTQFPRRLGDIWRRTRRTPTRTTTRRRSADFARLRGRGRLHDELFPRHEDAEQRETHALAQHDRHPRAVDGHRLAVEPIGVRVLRRARRATRRRTRAGRAASRPPRSADSSSPFAPAVAAASAMADASRRTAIARHKSTPRPPRNSTATVEPEHPERDEAAVIAPHSATPVVVDAERRRRGVRPRPGAGEPRHRDRGHAHPHVDTDLPAR